MFLIEEINKIALISNDDKRTYPADTQRSEDVPLCFYFGRDVPDHNRTEIRLIRFLTYFGFAISGMHLASGNIEKFP